MLAELDSKVVRLKLLSSPHIGRQSSCKISDDANTWRLPLGARPASQESEIPMVSPTFILGLEASRQSAGGHRCLPPANSSCASPTARCPRACGNRRPTQHAPGRVRSRPRSLALPLGARRQSAAGDTRLRATALSDGQICDGGSVAPSLPASFACSSSASSQREWPDGSFQNHGPCTPVGSKPSSSSRRQMIRLGEDSC
jgi:hypothetical protein